MKTRVKILLSLTAAICIGGAAFCMTYHLMQEDEFYIYNLGIDINDKIIIFYPFGDGFQHEGAKILPTFEYYTEEDSRVAVYAPCDGVIGRIDFQDETQDFEILIIPRNNRTYKVFLDHVNDVQVAVGDKVSAGQVLGKIGNVVAPVEFRPSGIVEYVRTELMIKDMRQNTFVAPFAVFDPQTKAQYEQQIVDLMQRIDANSGFGTFFDEEQMIYAGCYFETLPGEDSPEHISPVETIAGIGVGIGSGVLGGLALWFVIRNK